MKVDDIVSGARLISAGRTYHVPKVSIITPTYCRNSEGLLAKCLDSAMAQTFEDFELIVVDDGSSDGSEFTIRDAAFRDDRIVYLRHDRNSGLPAVRTNEGVMRARGEAIAFLFDDNIYQADFIETAWDALQRSGADVVHANVHMFAKEGKDFILGGWPLTLELLRNLNTIPNGGVMVRRSFFERFGMYDPHILMRRVCDWDLWLRALALGAKFCHVDQTGAVEYGLVSENSIGNTVAWDVKVAYGYMLDEARFADRARRLSPDAIANYDVLDPTRICKYVRNAREWSQLTDAVYKPFLARHSTNGFDPTFPGNRAASIDAMQGWNADWSLIANRRRYLVVSNSINAWASTWLRVLRQQSGTIVVNCPEWQLAAFAPESVDLLVLLDCTAAFIKTQLEAFRAASVPILYVLGYGEHVSNAASATVMSRHFANNPHIRSLLGPEFYFPQSGISFDSNQREGAKSLAHMAYATVSADKNSDRFGISDVIAFPFTEVVGPTATTASLASYQIAYGAETADADEVVALPQTTLTARSGTSVRSSWEGLGALAECRPQSRITVDADVVSEAPLAERVGLAAIVEQRGIALNTSEDLLQEMSDECPTADGWQGWIANLALSTQLARHLASIRRVPATRPNVGIFLNSEMFSGSEIYGLMLARSLVQVGCRVQVLIPEESVYGIDSDAGRLNAWLSHHGLPPAQPAPYRPGSVFFAVGETERSTLANRVAAFLGEKAFDVLICAGFMPVIAAAPDVESPLFMALFQPSAYKQAELACLRGRISGLISDSVWSFGAHRRLLGGPGAVVRAMLPVDPGSEARPKTPRTTGNIRLAMGGTLQPRKRQLEAIEAVRILRDRGVPVELNIYGYALGMLDGYVRQINETIRTENLGGLVRTHGLVMTHEMARDNDIVLMASTDESLPQTLAEMMRLGLIGVAGLSGGIDELIEDRVSGYLTSDLSPRGLADVLARAIADRRRWPDIATAARKRLDAEYSIVGNTSALLNLLIDGAQIESSPFGRLGRFSS
ncbi:MAG: glycosyltransferase [Alphaproteobacteria bacterium]